MAGSKNFFSTSNVVQAGAAGSVAPAGGAGEEILSQMSGSVFKILVQNGAQVSVGQTVLGLEAMKVESGLSPLQQGVWSSRFLKVSKFKLEMSSQSCIKSCTSRKVS